jgi:hypothetical protein
MGVLAFKGHNREIQIDAHVKLSEESGLIDGAADQTVTRAVPGDNYCRMALHASLIIGLMMG